MTWSPTWIRIYNVLYRSGSGQMKLIRTYPHLGKWYRYRRIWIRANDPDQNYMDPGPYQSYTDPQHWFRQMIMRNSLGIFQKYLLNAVKLFFQSKYAIFWTYILLKKLAFLKHFWFFFHLNMSKNIYPLPVSSLNCNFLFKTNITIKYSTLFSCVSFNFGFASFHS